MHNGRNLFFILILILIILSTSFVSASENITGDDQSSEIIAMSASDEFVVDESLDVENKESKLALTDNLDRNESKNLTNNDAQLLGISNDEDDVLGAPEVLYFSGGKTNGQYIEDVMYAIYDLGTRDGGTIYLTGGNYYSGGYWGQNRIPDLGQYDRVTIKKC